MNRNVTYWSIAVAVAGFLFGFDTAVISGADLPLQSLWPIGDLGHGLLIMSSALWGTVIGALFGIVGAVMLSESINRVFTDALSGTEVMQLVLFIAAAMSFYAWMMNDDLALER